MGIFAEISFDGTILKVFIFVVCGIPHLAIFWFTHNSYLIYVGLASLSFWRIGRKKHVMRCVIFDCGLPVERFLIVSARASRRSCSQCASVVVCATDIPLDTLE